MHFQDEGSKDIYFGVAEEAIYLFSSPTKVCESIYLFVIMLLNRLQEYTDQFLFSHLRGWVGVKDGSGLYKGKISSVFLSSLFIFKKQVLLYRRGRMIRERVVQWLMTTTMTTTTMMMTTMKMN